MWWLVDHLDLMFNQIEILFLFKNQSMRSTWGGQFHPFSPRMVGVLKTQSVFYTWFGWNIDGMVTCVILVSKCM